MVAYQLVGLVPPNLKEILGCLLDIVQILGRYVLDDSLQPVHQSYDTCLD